MSEHRIVPVDPHDPEQFDPWHAAYLAAEHAAPPGVTSPWQLEEVRAMMLDQGTRHRLLGYAGVVDDRVVASGFLRLPLLDNTDSAELMVHVVPEARRRGHGSAMLAHLEGVARDHGRSVLQAESSWPYAAGPDGVGEPGPSFAVARGFALALGDVKRVLRLPVPEGVLADLAAEAAEHHAGYTLRSWAGPVPDELAEGWVRLSATLGTEAPTGEMQREEEAADVAVLREAEATVAAQGRTKYNTVALDPSGEVVAYTDLATTIHEPGKAYQWGTLVRRDARGHRLGLAVKVANLRLLQAERPDIVLLTTYNAEVNAHMVGVNERLGFEPVARLGEFQRLLPDAEQGPTG
ncbi:MAG TPA: GNAT family N-acetyltransferase [Nocardioides sp.]|nr:GNAT family N-acetyltransferase [Nocardioides sp.]